MRADRLLTTVDFHTAGIGMRLVTSGLGRLPGETMADKRRHLQQRMDPEDPLGAGYRLDA